MQRLTLWVLSVCVLFCLSCDDDLLDAPLDTPEIEIKGFSHAAFYDGAYEDSQEFGSLSELKAQTASEWVALCVFEFQENAQSNRVEANFSGRNPMSGEAFMSTSSFDDIRQGIQQARNLNMRIMLKPHVDLYDGSWRGTIQPSDSRAWFES